MSTNAENFFDQHIILEDDWVKLEPLEPKHYDLLLPIAMQEKLWQFTVGKCNSPEAFQQYFRTALHERQQHIAYPFAQFDKRTNQYAGSTRFGHIDFRHKRLEIGWTWIDTALHGTGFNRHAKYLLLHYAFDTLQLNRVELKTHHLNLQSQAAMLKIGATKEGTFRNHIINEDGSIRHSVYFSFIKEEWPQIKQDILGKLIP